MKQIILKRAIRQTAFSLVALLLLGAVFILFASFKPANFGDDFLKQLGISKPGADEKIAYGFLGGGLDMEGVKNAKNIALGNRRQVVLDLIGYTKKYISSPAFIAQYKELKESHRPQQEPVATPEAFRAESIAMTKKAVDDITLMVKNADASMKPVFEKSLEAAKKSLKDVEDPANKHQVAYAKNYPALIKNLKELHEQQLAQWEAAYPTNHLLFIKKRLQQFLDETADIDFDAALTTKSGIKYFVNQAYEQKGDRWKMAFRAGKEVVAPAREEVAKWMAEIQ